MHDFVAYIQAIINLGNSQDMITTIVKPASSSYKDVDQPTIYFSLHLALLFSSLLVNTCDSVPPI